MALPCSSKNILHFQYSGQGIIGIYEKERKEPQPIRIDVQASFDPRKNAEQEQRDEISSGILAVLSNWFVKHQPFWVENMCLELMEAIWKHHPQIEWITIKAGKPKAIPFAQMAGVEMLRFKKDPR